MNQQKCRFYSNGVCKYSDKCSYSHDFEVKTEDISLNNRRVQDFEKEPPRFQKVKEENEKTEEGNNEDFQDVTECLQDLKAGKDEIQPFTVKWQNTRGRWYQRPLEEQDVSKKDYISVDEKSNNAEKLEGTEANENADNLEKLRETEIKQFKKRFPKYVEISEGIYQFEYFPTDPDWPFEVKSINLQVEFPNQYPEVSFLITVVDNDILPDMLIRHINRTVRNWISDKWEKNNDNVDLAFRPFLRWLDKNLEEIFICGSRWTKEDIETKAAGIEFVPYEMCNSKFDSVSNENDSNDGNDSSKDSYETEQNIEKSEEITDENKDIINTTRQLSINDSSKDSYEMEQNVKKSEEIIDENRDTIITTRQLSINYSLEPNKKNNYSGMKIEITFKDLHFAAEAESLTCQELQIVIMCNRCKSHYDLAMLANTLIVATCTKCQMTQELIFQPLLLHHYSSILGYVCLQQWQIIDFYLVSCKFAISCLNCSNQSTFIGIHYNRLNTKCCLFCKSKLKVTIQGMKFLKLKTPKSVEKFQSESVKLNSKLIKNQILPVQIGKPLPNSSMHWEGGKGCRDKIKMSRSDKHKYSGKNKTKSVKKVSANVKSVQ